MRKDFIVVWDNLNAGYSSRGITFDEDIQSLQCLPCMDNSGRFFYIKKGFVGQITDSELIMLLEKEVVDEPDR